MRTCASQLLRFLGYIVCSLMAVILSAYASVDFSDNSIIIEKNIRWYVAKTDGRFIATNDLVILINYVRALNLYPQGHLSENRTIESLEVVEAFTKNPDDRKVLVNPDQIKVQQRESSNAPMFQGSLVKTVIFPEVAICDRLIIHFKTHCQTALFSQHFESLSHPAFRPTDQYTLIYDLPEGLLLYTDISGFEASSPVTAAGRRGCGGGDTI
jgi:hypothetical protein